MFVVVAFLLTTLAVGKRIERKKGASALFTNGVASDPFEGYDSCVMAAESGCKATGWKATYTCSGTPEETSISIKIKPTGKTSIKFGDRFLSISPKPLQALAGKFSLEEVAEQVCSPELKDLIPNACGFFTAKNIAKVCGVETATWVGDQFEKVRNSDQFKAVQGGVKDAFDKASEQARKAQEPLHPMGDGLGPLIQIGEGSGCTKKGWKGTYYSMGDTPVLTIDIEGSKTTITASLDVVDNLPDGFKTGLNFERKTKEVAKMVCKDPAVLKQFPDACPFFKPLHLGLLCPKSKLYDLSKGLAKGGKKLWGFAKGFFDNSDVDGFDD